jgi:hypothetical protein
MPATITHRFRRYIALPAVSAGVIGGAALGMAGMANASTYPSHDPTKRTGIDGQPCDARGYHRQRARTMVAGAAIPSR